MVEDEPLLRASLARGLRRLRGIDVIEAATILEAKKALSGMSVSMVLSDLDLPDGSGIEVAMELDRLGMRLPVIFVSAFVGKYRAQLANRSDIEVYEKPVSLERLRALVEQRLGTTAAAAPFAAPDYVQLAGLGRHSVVIEIEDGTRSGIIVVRGGQVQHAADKRGQGMEAFRRLVFARGASVSCRALVPDERYPETLSGSCESALLEAARQLDEAHDAAAAIDDGWSDVMPPSVPPTEASARPPAADTFAQESPSRRWWVVSESHTPTIAERSRRASMTEVTATTTASRELRFEKHYEEGVEALLARDYARAAREFQMAAQYSPDDPRVRANLHRLRELGFGG